MERKRRFILCCAGLMGAGAVLAGVGLSFGGSVYGMELGGRGLTVSAPLLMKEDAYEKKELETEAFSELAVTVQEADMDIRVEASDHYGIAFWARSDRKPECRVENGKLIFKLNSGRKDFVLFRMGMDVAVMGKQKESVTFYVPEQVKLSDIRIVSDTGDISCGQIQAASLEIQSDYGDVEISGAQADAIALKLDSGELSVGQMSGGSCSIESEYGEARLQDIALDGDLRIKLESGSLSCDGLKAGTFTAENEYGDIVIRRMETADIALDSDSGDVSLEGAQFSNADISAQYGDVEIGSVAPLADYYMKLSVEYGEITVNGEEMGAVYKSVDASADKKLRIVSDSGDVELWEE